MSHLPFCGRATPRWSVSGHGLTPASMARLPYWSACVSVGPPLSAIASSVNVGAAAVALRPARRRRCSGRRRGSSTCSRAAARPRPTGPAFCVPHAVEVAALGGDVPVAAAALQAAADDRVAGDDRDVRLRRDVGHEVGLDHADAAAARGGVAPDGHVDRASARRRRRGRGRRRRRPRCCPRCVVFSISESPSARLKMPPPSPSLFQVAVLGHAGVPGDVAQEERAADDQVVVGRVGEPAAARAAVQLHGRVEDREHAARRVVDAAAVERRRGCR